MEQIIQPIDKQVLKAELTPERKLRRTNKSNNEIYIVTWQDSPNVLREIGRLREIAFRAAGGGTGKALDLDEFDTCTNPYKQ
ncbi:MAG: hemolysin, partial [Bacteroidaceae bacterium]|nr:hemolysin [Bacteroidaceae bacterium]